MDVSAIIAYESGELSRPAMLRLFSNLVRTGSAWTLQGHYGRTARALIDAGELDEDGTILADIEDFEDEDPDAGEPEDEDAGRTIEDMVRDGDLKWGRGVIASAPLNADGMPDTFELPDGRHNSHPAPATANEDADAARIALANLDRMVRNVLTDSQLDTRTQCGRTVRAVLAENDRTLGGTAETRAAEREALADRLVGEVIDARAVLRAATERHAKLGRLVLEVAADYHLLRDFKRDAQARYDERTPLGDAMARDAMRALMLRAANGGLL